MNKLIEMENAGVNFSIYGGPYWGRKWHVTAKREDDGIKLEIVSKHRDLETAIDDVYEKWLAVTSHGARNLGLNQIDYVPLTSTNLDDEIPF